MKRQSVGREPILTPSDFVAVFNQSVEMIYPSVTIVGELANFRISKNRWVYFDLIDESSSVKFFASAMALPGPLENGLNLEVVGLPRLHPNFGFSINVASIQVVGAGSIAKAQMLLARKLAAEGLFDDERKRSLPYPPQKIGLITSFDSAAYADFIKIIGARWPALSISVFDTLVQGADAPSQIVGAIEQANQTADFDVLVLTRGGGSADDLAAFSAEPVVRAVASSRTPTLVAIGHEVDKSLAELAADVRASTPSNAAELLVPDLTNETRDLAHKSRLLGDRLLGFWSQKQYDLEEAGRLLGEKTENIFNHHRQLFDQKKLLFSSLDPKKPLKRGYSIVTTPEGKIITKTAQARKSGRIKVGLSDGSVRAKVEK